MKYRIIKVRKHKARKWYTYYGGVIQPSDMYYRCFAVNEYDAPFEIMFTDENMYENNRIPVRIVKDEIRIYKQTKHQLTYTGCKHE